MNISLCITVKNEEKSIGPLLDSVFSGTKIPNEIVIVDGGSTDATASVISNYQLPISNKRSLAKSEFGKIPKFKFITTKKIGVATGRNLSIKNAKGNIIVHTDAGCTVKRDWLEKITQPFINKNVDIVAGYYEMPANTPLQSVINVYQGIPPERFDKKSFVPSARSVAFKKSVWEKVGGYDENLKGAGEDTLFFYKAAKFKFKMERVEKAKVIWEETRNLTLRAALNKFFKYAMGDAKTGILWDPNKQLMSHNIKILSIFLRYFIGLLLVLITISFNTSPLLPLGILILYLFYPIYKWYDVIKSFWGLLWLPVVQVLSDFAVMAGFVSGIIEK